MSRYTHSAELRLPMREGAESFRRLLAVEAGEFFKKVRVSVETEEDGLRVLIEGEDSSSLRAAMTAILNWVGLITEMRDECRTE